MGAIGKQEMIVNTKDTVRAEHALNHVQTNHASRCASCSAFWTAK